MAYKVLISTPNERRAALIRNALHNMGHHYQLITALSVGASIAHILRDTFDLILYDWQFEKLQADSFEHFHTVVSGIQIPIIAIANVDDLPDVYESGATDYVNASLNPIELQFRVKSALAMYKLHNGILEQNKKLEDERQALILEKQKSDRLVRESNALLNNILPELVADQLRTKGKVVPKTYKMVSIMFTDFKGFTKISEQFSPVEIMNTLDHLFGVFDEITSKHYIEKLKTIGDAYMCAGGLPIRNRSNPINIVLAALEIQDYMNTYNQGLVMAGLPPWYIRIGIHTGKVSAGVIGKRKFAYDIWGDSVNTASRMESSGEPSRINISGDTYEYIKEYFNCTYRGKIEAKNKGSIDMYFVEGLKPEFAADPQGISPNSEFFHILSEF